MGVNINFYVSGLETAEQRRAFVERLAEARGELSAHLDRSPMVIVGSWLRYLSGERWDGRSDSWPHVREQARAVVDAALSVTPSAVVWYTPDVNDFATVDELARLRVPQVDDTWFDTMTAAHADPAMLINDGRAGTWRVNALDEADFVVLSRVEDDGRLTATRHGGLWAVSSMDYFTGCELTDGIAVGERVRFALTDPDCDHMPCADCSFDEILDVESIEDAALEPAQEAT